MDCGILHKEIQTGGICGQAKIYPMRMIFSRPHTQSTFLSYARK